MSTHETMTVLFDLIDDSLKPRAIDGNELANWQDGPDVAVFIKQMEKEGWAVSKLISSNTYLFERNLP